MVAVAVVVVVVVLLLLMMMMMLLLLLPFRLVLLVRLVRGVVVPLRLTPHRPPPRPLLRPARPSRGGRGATARRAP